MWTTIDLLSSLFGYWAMGTGVWLFCPELYDLLKYPPREIDRARLVFFASWLLGDFLQLAGTVASGHAEITQICLYIIVAVIESFVVVWILFSVGYLPCKPRRHLAEELDVQNHTGRRHPVTHALVLGSSLGPELQMPPGDRSLKEHRQRVAQDQIDAANRSRRARGKKTDWKPKSEPSRATMRLIQIGGTFLVLAVFTAVWYGAAYMQRSTLDPPEPMQFSLVAFVPGWLGFFFWVAPRFYSMWQSYHEKKKEGITTAAICVGALTHGFNVASVMLINYQGEGLLAQSPYIATSAMCIVLDVLRLALKAHYADRAYLPPDQDHSVLYPAKAFYDPDWTYRHPDTIARTKRKADQAGRKGSSRQNASGSSGGSAVRKGLLSGRGRPNREHSSAGEEAHVQGPALDPPSDLDGAGETDEEDWKPRDPLNSKQRYAQYLAQLSTMSGAQGFGLARQLHPARLPGESDAHYEERQVRAKAVQRFVRQRAEQNRRLTSVDELHGLLDARSSKTLRREQEFADPTTSDVRRRKLEAKLHQSETVHEPLLHKHIRAVLDDPTLEEDDRDELHRRHNAYLAKPSPAQVELAQYRAVRKSKTVPQDRISVDEAIHQAGKAGEDVARWRPGVGAPDEAADIVRDRDESAEETNARRRSRLQPGARR